MFPFFYGDVSKGVQKGPVVVADLKQLFASGEINADTLVWTEGQGEWKPLKAHRIGPEILESDVKAKPRVMEHMRMVPNLSGPTSNAGSPSISLKMPQRVKLNSEYSVGQEVWVRDPEEEWVLGKVRQLMDDDEGKQIKVATEDSEVVLNVELDVKAANPSTVPDVTSLPHINEPGILHNLRLRSKERAAYTFMASAMIAVNPLRRLVQPSIQDYALKQSGKGGSEGVAPHPYSVAELAFQDICFNKKNQSVIVSGESGAGKTETAKMLLKYLAGRQQAVDGCSSGGSGGRGGEDGSSSKAASLDAKLLQSSPILESFGNAKTVRNNNSSRFGKFLKLMFEDRGSSGSGSKRSSSASAAHMTLIGASVETYLLEKNRVLSQSDEECNFHIFYQLLAGAPAGIALGSPDSFQMLNQRSFASFRDIQETCPLDAVAESFKTIGYSKDEIQSVWRILAGILHMGNVTFDAHESNAGETAKVSSSGQKALRLAAEMLSLDPALLSALFTEREVYTGGELINIHLTPTDAAYTRDATAKILYESLFAYIVNTINISLCGDEQAAKRQAAAVSDKSPKGGKNLSQSKQKGEEKGKEQFFVGVLDIFGFENFARNDYEQLLINFANEALQNTFNQQIFEREIDLFRRENIEVPITDIPNNKACVELIAGKGKNRSILNTLDIICRQTQPSDERFCEELHKTLSGRQHPHREYFPSVHRKDMRTLFCVKHYAGVVRYSVQPSPASSVDKRPASIRLNFKDMDAAAKMGAGAAGTSESSAASWIAKNNDAVPEGLDSLFAGSKLEFFRKINPAESMMISARVGVAGTGGGGGSAMSVSANGRRRSSFINKPTVAMSFSRSMDELNALLLSTSAHFIRCIKPNPRMLPDDFDTSYVLEQLRALGIQQASEVLKVCFPTRVRYSDLCVSLASVLDKVKHLVSLPTSSSSPSGTPASFSGSEGSQGKDSDSSEMVLLISSVLKAYEVPTEIYRLGRSMVFFRSGQLPVLQNLLESASGASSDAKKQKEIAMRIQEAITATKASIALVKVAEEQFGEIEEKFDSLDEEYNDLVARSKNIPDVKGLDLPSDFTGKISVIESKLETARIRHQELSKRHAALVAKLRQNESKLKDFQPATKSKPGLSGSQGRVRDWKALQAAVLVGAEQVLREIESCTQSARDQYDVLHETVQELEDEYGGGLYDAFHEKMEGNDSLLDSLQKHVLECGQGVQSARDAAERCEAERAGEAVQESTEKMMKLKGEIQGIERHFEEARALIKKLDDGSNNAVDFSALNSSATEIVRHLTGGSALIESASADLVSTELDLDASLTAAVATSASSSSSSSSSASLEANKPTKPAKPTKGSGSGTGSANGSDAGSVAGSEAGGSGAGAVRRSSINYSIKDLLKAKQAASAAALTSASGGDDYSAAGSSATDGTKSSIAGALPYGWREQRDKKTNRPYYVNITTKERQWARPLSAGSDESKRQSGNPDEDAESGEREGELPQGWRAVTDKRSKRTYYVNDVTKLRQWKRPTTAATFAKPPLTTRTSLRKSQSRSASQSLSIDHEGSADYRGGNDSLNVLREDVARRRRMQERGEAAAPEEEEEGNVLLRADSSDTTAMRNRYNSHHSLAAERARQAIKSMHLEEPEQNRGRNSVTYLTAIGRADKSGYLMKQGGFISRWKRRFVVLRGDTIEYFDREKDAVASNNGTGKGKGKVFQLTGGTLTMHTSIENCFCVCPSPSPSAAGGGKGTEERENGDTWFLLADTADDMQDWMTAINAHTHIKFLQEQQSAGEGGGVVSTDHWDEGMIALSFWHIPQVAPGMSRRPLGIRTLPIENGPRTGEGIYCGEICEVVQTIERVEASGVKQRYLRLGGDRGWVFEYHPSGNYTVMSQLEGNLVSMPIKAPRRYEYAADFLENLEVYFSPSAEPDQRTGDSFPPGSIVLGSAEWTPAVDRHSSLSSETDFNEEDYADCYESSSPASPASSVHNASSSSPSSQFTFVKLADGQGCTGWVSMRHPITGGRLLEPLNDDDNADAVTRRREKKVR